MTASPEEILMETVETNLTYSIPTGLLSSLNKRINKINKRAAKIGCPPVKLVEHSRHHKVARDYREAVDIGSISYAAAPKVEYVELSVEGEAPKIKGWTFVGKLDHHSLPGSVIVDTAPGHTVPREFFTKAPLCDHCGKHRIRKDTFVLQDGNNAYKQVGRLCVRDFIGYDVTAIVAYFSFLHTLSNELEEEENEYWGRSSREEWYFDLTEVLKNTVATIRTFGWTPRSAANEKRVSTANTVGDLLAPTTNSYIGNEIEKLRAKIKFVPEEDEAETIAALEWVKKQDATSEYMHNLRAIVEAGQVTMKLFGYACSIISSYQRAMEKLQLNKAEKILNDYVGIVGEKLESTVRVTRVSYIEGFYGVTALHNMMDEQGHVITWFASNGTKEMDEGHTYVIKGTIKDHSEYQGRKQTVLKRVKVVKEVSLEQ